MKVWELGLCVGLVALAGQVEARVQGLRDLGYMGVPAREMMPPECVVRFDRGGVGGPKEKDAAQWRAMEIFLTMNPMVMAASHYGWGKEGERTYCVMPRPGVDACMVATEMSKILQGSTMQVEVDMLPMAEMCDTKGRRIKVPEEVAPEEAAAGEGDAPPAHH